MRIFVYEFITGGGWYSCDSQGPGESLVSEGRAMLSALTADFALLPEVEVDALHDVRYSLPEIPGVTFHEVDSAVEEGRQFARCARAADWSVVIAPEFGGFLASRSRAVAQSGGCLLGCSPRTIALAADKQATAEHLAAHGVAVPHGVAIESGAALPESFTYPAVLKPRDGAGSLDVVLVEQSAAPAIRPQVPSRLEPHFPGLPASVAFFCGPRKIAALAACRQVLSSDGRFRYLGGRLPLDPARAERARALASRAVATLDKPLGYVGVDLVLGDDPAGSDDVVIEINPRLTTSYVGLRALAGGNLAEALLAVAEGRSVELCWQAGRVEFDSCGRVRPARQVVA